MRLTRLFKFALVLTLVALALPASAMGQATRTWVSGVGDDANPCSRTAPCKTLAGAISKTAAKGEINAIDSGGFGGVTITKSITIDLRSVHGGVLVSGTNAIVVNAAATDRVVLQGLRINGLGTGLHGIRVLSARSVKIQDVDIFGFVRNGVDIENSSALTRVFISDSRIRNNTGNGVLAAPTGSNAARVSVGDSEIEDNGCGLTAARHGADPAFNFNVNCGTNAPNATTATAAIHTFDSSVTENANVGIFSNGSTARSRFGRNTIVGNNNGILAANSGELVSFQNNQIIGNHIANGTPTSTTAGS